MKESIELKEKLDIAHTLIRVIDTERNVGIESTLVQLAKKKLEELIKNLT